MLLKFVILEVSSFFWFCGGVRVNANILQLRLNRIRVLNFSLLNFWLGSLSTQNSFKLYFLVGSLSAQNSFTLKCYFCYAPEIGVHLRDVGLLLV